MFHHYSLQQYTNYQYCCTSYIRRVDCRSLLATSCLIWVDGAPKNKMWEVNLPACLYVESSIYILLYRRCLQVGSVLADWSVDLACLLLAASTTKIHVVDKSGRTTTTPPHQQQQHDEHIPTHYDRKYKVRLVINMDIKRCLFFHSKWCQHIYLCPRMPVCLHRNRNCCYTLLCVRRQQCMNRCIVAKIRYNSKTPALIPSHMCSPKSCV